MIPSALSHQIRKSIDDFLRTTFPMANPFFDGILDRFLAGNDIARGPWLSVALPFISGTADTVHFPDLPIPFRPYKHQQMAFERLKTPKTRSTLIATGTGSGKTECFLYPILDHCWRNRDRKGVKAIIVYPMNALAADQATRLARLIWGSDDGFRGLRNQVTAGMYVGQKSRKPSAVMTRDSIVTIRDAIRATPPDILLTNYKMLDYLLIRPADKPLWRFNEPDTLQYIVVDELHTFDGAQGTDLACLIRRLKARLRTPGGHLCCIGTSATMSNPQQAGELLEYATAVFGEPFDPDALITEYRQPVAEFLAGSDIRSTSIPAISARNDLDPEQTPDPDTFIRNQIALWFPEEQMGVPHHQNGRGNPAPTFAHPSSLVPPPSFPARSAHLGPSPNIDYSNSSLQTPSRRERQEGVDHTLIPEQSSGRRAGEEGPNLIPLIKSHAFFHALMDVLSAGPAAWDAIVDHLESRFPALAGQDRAFLSGLLLSFTALISAARDPEGSAGGSFLSVRIQYWLREWRRIVCTVDRHPDLKFADDLDEDALGGVLPLLHCRDCHAVGWGGVKFAAEAEIRTDLQHFYRAFFSHDPKTVFLFPDPDGDAVEPGGDGRDMTGGVMDRLCSRCMHLAMSDTANRCPHCGAGPDDMIRVFVPAIIVERNERNVASHDCPYCGARDGLTVVGSQAASLTSVMISRLFASRYNNDKKMLAFSDSVQDAAHRAGFFSARTYRFSLRAAIQQFVDGLGTERTGSTGHDGSPAMTLGDLPAAFVDHYHTGLSDNAFVAAFIPPDMVWYRDYESLRRSGRLNRTGRLMRDLERRIGWEILSEYGFRSLIGRTLERSGVSMASIDPARLNRAVEGIRDSLRNEFEIFRELPGPPLLRWLTGMLMRLKSAGGIMHPALDAYIRDNGETYLISRIDWMPGFGRHVRAPAFLSDGSVSDRFEPLFSSADRTRTWHVEWLVKCFGGDGTHPLLESYARAIYRIAIAGLVAEGILIETQTGRGRVWGIDPQALIIRTDVMHLRCGRCGRQVSTPANDDLLGPGAPCLRRHCRGVMTVDRTPPGNYYGDLYRHGEIHRIFSAEHTGLLDRKSREDLEEEFKSRPPEREPWYPNLLSCTPTLEMGINIGDLSSLILCSIPPGEANYIQRIGRAGRTDGNALILAVVNNRPHDLYYFANPDEMIRGVVKTPGVFLQASAVLERQLAAYCLDRWVAEGNDPDAIPHRLSQVLHHFRKESRTVFPHAFLRYLESHASGILRDFTEMFEDAIGDNHLIRERLELFMATSGNSDTTLVSRFVNGMTGRMEEITSLQSAVTRLNRRIRETTASPVRRADDADRLKEMEQEKAALAALIDNIRQMDTFQFLTDEGLIPNYAFPESGITLKSIIYRKKARQIAADGSARTAYETLPLQVWERAAGSAIRELAPNAVFYAGGRRVTIDQVDVRLSRVETWRFCATCSYMQLENTAESTRTCPRCGDPMWSDDGRKRPMLRLRQVYATTEDRQSRIADESEEREPVFYCRNLMVDVDPGNVTGAFTMEAGDVTFGFEFVARARFLEVNFGESDGFGETIMVAGREVPVKGFSLCRSCGKVQKRSPVRAAASGTRQEPPAGNHASSCPARDRSGQASLIDCFYLYRCFESEAIRMLLPATTFAGSDERLHSFIAALKRGLKEYFHGNIDHLSVTVQEDPAGDGFTRKRYLVLYDTVPGGTGYLKQLMREPGQMLRVFELALDVLQRCPCRYEEGRDGCYRCLFMYRDSARLDRTSRRTAVELFRSILAARTSIARTASITGISVNPLIESELEARFTDALKMQRFAGIPTRLEDDRIRGGHGYYLRVGDTAWDIQRQVSLGPRDGVTVPSRADLLIRPRRRIPVRPIAVFTDGFTWHRDRIARDLEQRMALIRSGRFLVWSLSFNDVENQFTRREDFYWNFVDTLPPVAKTALNRASKHAFTGLDSYQMLLAFLQGGDETPWRLAARLFGALMARIGTGPLAFPRRDNAGDPLLTMRCLSEPYPEVPGGVRSFIGAELNDSDAGRNDSQFEWMWNGMFRLMNFAQFADGCAFAARSLSSALPDESPSSALPDESPLLVSTDESPVGGDRMMDFAVPAADVPGIAPDRETADGSAARLETLLMESPECADLLRVLHRHGVLLPEIGFEPVDGRGMISGIAEAAWPDVKLALLTDQQMEHSRAAFETTGWVVIPVSESMNRMDQILGILTGYQPGRGTGPAGGV